MSEAGNAIEIIKKWSDTGEVTFAELNIINIYYKRKLKKKVDRRYLLYKSVHIFNKKLRSININQKTIK